MGIGDAILLVSCLAGFMAAFPALLIFLNITFVGTSERAAYRLTRGGITPFFVGLAVMLLVGIPASLMIAAGSVPQFLGSLIMLLLLMLGFLGLASVSRLIGYRVIEYNERDESPLIQALAGALVLSFGIAFPLIGWLIVLPFSLVVGTGAVMIGLLGRLFGRDSHAPTLAVSRTEFFEQEA